MTEAAIKPDPMAHYPLLASQSRTDVALAPAPQESIDLVDCQ